jgi:hypothetical protein
MILSKRVALGGVQLDELHERIVVLGVDPGTPDESISTVSRMGGFGQRVTGEHWETLDVTVTYGIDVQKREMELRRQIFDAVNAWARTRGWLTVNWMPNRRMYVDKVVTPSSGDMWDWTQKFDIIFRAYNVPFWQDEIPNQAARSLITSGSTAVIIGGNVQSVLDVEFRNRSGMTINNFAISAGGNSITLSNMGLGGSETLAFSHGTDGLLRITAGGRSVLDRRTGADDLYVNPGTVNVSISTERSGDLTVRNYGRYI